MKLPIEKSKGKWKKGRKDSYDSIIEARKEEPENVIQFPKEEIDVPDFMKRKSKDAR